MFFFLVHQCTVSIKAILNDKKQGNVLVAKTVSVFIEVIKTVERLLCYIIDWEEH